MHQYADVYALVSSLLVLKPLKIFIHRPAHARTQERGNHSDLRKHGRREQARECQSHHAEAKDNAKVESRRRRVIYLLALLSVFFD